MSDRQDKDHEIDLSDISIPINGLPTTTSNPRCASNNKNDGFVYSTATNKNSKGAYQYLYSKTKDSGDYLGIIRGSEASHPLLSIGAIRDLDGADSKNEGIINVLNLKNNSKQIGGSVTSEGDFMYNEGFSSTLTNVKFDVTGKNITTDVDYPVQYTDESGNISFFNKNADVYSDMLTSVRNLPSTGNGSQTPDPKADGEKPSV